MRTRVSRLHGRTLDAVNTWYTICNQPHDGQTHGIVPCRNHSSHRRRALEGGCAGAALSRCEEVFRTEAIDCADNTPHTISAASGITDGRHRGTHCLSRQAAPRGVHDHAPGKLLASLTRRDVSLGKIALRRHGSKKTPRVGTPIPLKSACVFGPNQMVFTHSMRVCQRSPEPCLRKRRHFSCKTGWRG